MPRPADPARPRRAPARSRTAAAAPNRRRPPPSPTQPPPGPVAARPPPARTPLPSGAPAPSRTASARIPRGRTAGDGAPATRAGSLDETPASILRGLTDRWHRVPQRVVSSGPFGGDEALYVD